MTDIKLYCNCFNFGSSQNLLFLQAKDNMHILTIECPHMINCTTMV